MAKKRGNGEGTIVKRADGRWMASITVGRDPLSGKLKRATFYAKTRQEVATRLVHALRDTSHGVFVAPQKLTLGAWLDSWLTDYKRPAVRPLTFESYAMIIRRHLQPALGHIPLRDLRPEHLQHFYTTHQDFAPRTVRYWHTVLHGALAQAERNHLVARNVSTLTDLPRQEHHERQTLSIAQVAQTLLPALQEDRLAAAIVLAFGAGLRRGEVLGLRWQDVDLHTAVVHVRQTLARVSIRNASPAGTRTQLTLQEPKTPHSRRTIPLPAVGVTALRQHKARQAADKLLLGPAYQDQGLIFCSPQGTPLDPTSLNRRLTRLLHQTGLPHMRLHDARHTFATLLLELGESPKTVQTMLGHSSVAMTLGTYSHVTLELETKVASKLNRALQGQG